MIDKNLEIYMRESYIQKLMTQELAVRLQIFPGGKLSSIDSDLLVLALQEHALAYLNISFVFSQDPKTMYMLPNNSYDVH